MPRRHGSRTAFTESGADLSTNLLSAHFGHVDDSTKRALYLRDLMDDTLGFLDPAERWDPVLEHIRLPRQLSESQVLREILRSALRKGDPELSAALASLSTTKVIEGISNSHHASKGRDPAKESAEDGKRDRRGQLKGNRRGNVLVAGLPIDSLVWAGFEVWMAVIRGETAVLKRLLEIVERREPFSQREALFLEFFAVRAHEYEKGECLSADELERCRQAWRQPTGAAIISLAVKAMPDSVKIVENRKIAEFLREQGCETDLSSIAALKKKHGFPAASRGKRPTEKRR